MWAVHVAHSERVAAEATASASTASYNRSEADKWKRAYTSYVNGRRNVYIQRAHSDFLLLLSQEPKAGGAISPLPKVPENVYVVEICQRYERFGDATTYSLEENQTPDEPGRGFVQRAAYRASYQRISECHPGLKDLEKGKAYLVAARFFVVIKNHDTPTDDPIIFSYKLCVCSGRKAPHVRDGSKCKMNLYACGFTMAWRWVSSIRCIYRSYPRSKRTSRPTQYRPDSSHPSPGPPKVASRKRTEPPARVSCRVTFRNTLDLAYYNDVFGVLVRTCIPMYFV